MDEPALGTARRLTVSYIVASTVILAASGLLVAGRDDTFPHLLS